MSYRDSSGSDTNVSASDNLHFVDISLNSQSEDSIFLETGENEKMSGTNYFSTTTISVSVFFVVLLLIAGILVVMYTSESSSSQIDPLEYQKSYTLSVENSNLRVVRKYTDINNDALLQSGSLHVVSYLSEGEKQWSCSLNTELEGCTVENDSQRERSQTRRISGLAAVPVIGPTILGVIIVAPFARKAVNLFIKKLEKDGILHSKKYDKLRISECVECDPMTLEAEEEKERREEEVGGFWACEGKCVMEPGLQRCMDEGDKLRSHVEYYAKMLFEDLCRGNLDWFHCDRKESFGGSRGVDEICSPEL